MEVHTPTNGISKHRSTTAPSIRKSLSSLPRQNSDKQLLRVVQKNVVYVTNIPSSIAEESKLTAYEYFGQYGRILKCTLNRSKAASSFNAYFTFESEQSAALCITACNYFRLESNTLEATLGTTRYCSYFFQNKQCPRSDCLFLHERKHDCEVFLKDASSREVDFECNFSCRVIESNDTVLPRARVIDRRSRFRFAREEEPDGESFKGSVCGLTNVGSPSQLTTQMSYGQYKELVKGAEWAVDIIDAVKNNGVYLVSPRERNSINS